MSYRESKGSKPFRVSKNKKQISFIKKISGFNEIEEKIPKKGYIPPEIEQNNPNNINLNDDVLNEEREHDEIIDELEEK